MLKVKNEISSTEKTETMQILNLNTKTIENKHLIHYLYYLKRFPQTSSACFVMLTSKRNYIISAFYCCPNSQCSYIFKNRWLFPLQTFISLIIRFLFKCPRQEAKTKQQQNKTTSTATRSQECSPTNRRQPRRLFWRVFTGSLRCWLVFIAYCIF